MDGADSNIFFYFKSLILRGLMELKKHVDSFVKIIDIMARGKIILFFNMTGSKMPCFAEEISVIIARLVERFHTNKTEAEYIPVVQELINNCLNNWRTTQYDYFQKLTNDIRP